MRRSGATTARGVAGPCFGACETFFPDRKRGLLARSRRKHDRPERPRLVEVPDRADGRPRRPVALSRAGRAALVEVGAPAAQVLAADAAGVGLEELERH